MNKFFTNTSSSFIPANSESFHSLTYLHEWDISPILSLSLSLWDKAL